MSSEIPCTVLNKAINDKGYTTSQIAKEVGSSEPRIRDIVSGRERPTQQEFNKLAETLSITRQAPHNSSHTTA